MGGLLIEFERGGLRVVGADEAIAFAPALQHGRRFGAQHGVNATELPADFPGDFEKQRFERCGRGSGFWRWRFGFKFYGGLSSFYRDGWRADAAWHGGGPGITGAGVCVGGASASLGTSVILGRILDGSFEKALTVGGDKGVSGGTGCGGGNAGAPGAGRCVAVDR